MVVRRLLTTTAFPFLLPPPPSPSASAILPPHCNAPSLPCGSSPDCPPCRSHVVPYSRPDGRASRHTPHACSRTRYRHRKSPADCRPCSSARTPPSAPPASRSGPCPPPCGQPPPWSAPGKFPFPD